MVLTTNNKEIGKKFWIGFIDVLSLQSLSGKIYPWKKALKRSLKTLQ